MLKAKIYLPWGLSFEHFKGDFLNQIFAFYFRLSKTYSIKSSIKKTLGIYFLEAYKKRQKFNLKNVNWTFKLNLDLTWSCQNEPWYIVNTKITAYGRHQNLSTNADRSPNTKINFFGGGDVRTDIQRYGQTDGHTDGRRGGVVTFHMSTCDMSVQCNAMQTFSIVQFSTAVGWLTKKYKEVILIKNQAIELKFCKKHWRYKNCTEISLSSFVLNLTNLRWF